jgi:hypothetical protein
MKEGRLLDVFNEGHGTGRDKIDGRAKRAVRIDESSGCIKLENEKKMCGDAGDMLLKFETQLGKRPPAASSNVNEKLFSSYCRKTAFALILVSDVVVLLTEGLCVAVV